MAITIDRLTQDAVLRIGEVSEVQGRKIYIKVDKNKNLTDIFLDGDILKNISVNSYIEIRKGFLSIIGKVDGEKIEEEYMGKSDNDIDLVDKNKRYLAVSLSGYINQSGQFVGGTRELPLIGNEAFIVTKEKIHLIHNLDVYGETSICVATTDTDDIEVIFPVDGLFNTHIAIFGNTGSGKSNTLASLYQELYRKLDKKNPVIFKKNALFLLFDFNGEYIRPECITRNKKVYSLSTRHNEGDKIPIEITSLLDPEMVSILADATEKTQKPFIRRTLSLYNHVYSNDIDDPKEYIKNILKKEVKRILQMSDKIKVFLVLDYLRDILPPLYDEDEREMDIVEDLDWHNVNDGFKLKNAVNVFLQTDQDRIFNTNLYRHVDNLTLPDSTISRLIIFLYIQLIKDILANRAQNEHISPAINKLKSKQKDIDKIFETEAQTEFWASNFVVINLNDVNLDMKKTIPLLLSRKTYTDHKVEDNRKSLNIIIDEAHNILSRESFREAESWKDYRLETFEEIIKEGRKFGVFVTISSQRPNDISATITSQAHNYFIHRLINQKDLAMISSAVSYIDRITEESIPTLPTGTCIFSGIASQMPLKINVKELAEDLKPKSHTLKYADIIPGQ